MGDRVSIQFKHKKEKSVVLFSHWGGMAFVKTAQKYARELRVEMEMRPDIRKGLPLDRLEPQTVMIDFIRYLTCGMGRKNRVESDLYLGVDEMDGDNSDNGHHIIYMNPQKTLKGKKDGIKGR